jgi:SAM-dependent methyltransferase
MKNDWESEAENWLGWARRPGHDAYWFYAPAFFDEMVPPAGRRTLDIGCGEGRTTRDLSARGHRAVAIDSSPTLISHAARADGRSHYTVADAARLPFSADSFDVALAYNSLMDVDDMPGAVREAARVLESGGQFCASVTHPMSDAGRFQDVKPDSRFVVDGSYFGKRRYEEKFERDGLRVTFRGWCYPLEDYLRAFESAGFLVERLREPVAAEELVASQPSYQRWRRLPLFLQIRAVKQAPGIPKDDDPSREV